jgi:anti-anti-sigma factor
MAMSASDVRLQIDHRDGVVRVVGEIDASSCGALEAALAADGALPVRCIDMSGVTFVDSSGLRVLIGHREVLAALGHQLELRHPSQTVERLLEITGLSDVFDIITG